MDLDAAGEKKSDETFVFSDQTGEPIGRFRTAWVTAVLKAHGIKPECKAYGWTALIPERQERFRRIDLHWHDFRHEYTSRLVEKGAALSQVRDLLGHASISTTERYDNQTFAVLQAVAQRLESGKSFTIPSQWAKQQTSAERKPKAENPRKPLKNKRLTESGWVLGTEFDPG